MSFLFPKPAKPKDPAPAPPPPERSDSDIQSAADAQRRQFQGGGRASTILTGFGSTTPGVSAAAQLLGNVGG